MDAHKDGLKAAGTSRLVLTVKADCKKLRERLNLGKVELNKGVNRRWSRTMH